jgi:predicted MFS family arabinose efflux permease
MEAVAGFPRREVQAIGLVGFAHMLSHLYMLPLVPLVLIVTADLGISVTQYGIAIAAYAITTGVFQTPMGLLVERIGGRAVLAAGLALNAASYVLIGLMAADFWTFVALMALAGVGNSVFHPADYSLLSASVGDGRMGRAFSVHTFMGHVGAISGPIITAGLEPFIGWRAALIAIGALGLATTLVLLVFARMIKEGSKVKKGAPIGDSLRDLVKSPAVMLFFLFYICTAASNVGITQFSVAAFQNMYGLERVAAVVALTAYQLGTLALVLPGGLLADRTTRYDLILVLGFGTTALLILLAGTALLPFWMVVVVLCIGGALRGGINSTRDVAVRNVAPHIPVGTVFAFISTGFLLGQAVAGPFYGWLFDNYSPQYIFYVSAGIYVLGIATVVINPGTRRQQAAAAE